MLRIFFLLGVLLLINVASAQKVYLIVGTYTNNASKGIYVYNFNIDSATANLSSIATVNNPSFVTISPNQQYVYCVNENSDSSKPFLGGTVTAFQFDKVKGELVANNTVSSEGKHPCTITTNADGKTVVVGNYSSGTISIYNTKSDGSLAAPHQVIQHKGSSINTARQLSAHVHQVLFDKKNEYLYVPDLGMDSIKIYTYNKFNQTIVPHSNSGVAAVAGSGPRHLVLSKKEHFVYVMEELSGTVQVYKRTKDGALTAIQRIDAHPKGFTGKRGSADIHITDNGKFLYCTNRGESTSITAFSINKRKGTLNYIQNYSTGGLTPRNFTIDPSGNYVLVANQNSDAIQIFAINNKTGELINTNKSISVPNPVCLQWLRVK